MNRAGDVFRMMIDISMWRGENMDELIYYDNGDLFR